MTSLNLLQTICRDAHFAKRGKAYFRIVGDGVLQIVKTRYERALYSDVLYIGLFSMYGKLQPEWFTSMGCITKYPVVNCAIQKDMPLVIVPSMDEQVLLFRSKVLPWLDSVDTQKRLVTAITKLDRLWNDENKIAPYLACGEVNHAKKVIREIMLQHDFARMNGAAKDDMPYFDGIEWQWSRRDPLQEVLQMIDRSDSDAIRNYLQNNYTENMKQTRFMRKKV